MKILDAVDAFSGMGKEFRDGGDSFWKAWTITLKYDRVLAKVFNNKPTPSIIMFVSFIGGWIFR